MAKKKHKDWFNGDCALRIGQSIESVWPEFDTRGYSRIVARSVGNLELKDRVLLMATELRERLPEDYDETADILLESLGPTLPGETGMFTEGYWLMPIARLVEEFGLEDFDTSMKLCEAITQRHTAEYAMRPYIEQNTKKSIKYLRRWSKAKNLHVRRLASECARPRLPWARKLNVFIEEPQTVIDLVTPMRTDPSLYVRKSVANLINDVSKDHPALVKNLVKEWRKDKNDFTDWVIKHGTRSLTRQT